MMHQRVSLLVGAIGVLVASLAYAQCPNGTPGPQPEQYAANQLKLKYLSTGPGGGDDKPELKKSAFNGPLFAFNPATQNLHVTIRANSSVGNLLWTTTIPAGAPGWTQVTLSNGNVRSKYNDPLTPYGVKKAQIVDYTIGLHIITKLLGANTNIANAPLVPLVDAAYLLVEIEQAGVGICYDGVTTPCTGSGNTQTCKAL
jgi:hypothetical protein